MKKYFLFMLFWIVWAFTISFVGATDSRSSWGTDSTQILDKVNDEANDSYAIQETALDWVSDSQGDYSLNYKISNTLDYFRKNMHPYLQWIVYVGLVLATISIIYLGFLLVTWNFHKEGELSSIKKKLMNVVIWVILLTGFYFVVKLIVSIITAIFGDWGGESGF